VHRILGKRTAQVSLPEDQHAVGHFGADGQHEALGEAVRPRTAGGILTTSMPASFSPRPRGKDGGPIQAAGWTVTETGGYPGRVLESAVYYRPGTTKQKAS
jgi:hypothetical protein